MDKKTQSYIKEISQNYFICKNAFTLKSFSSGITDYSNPFYIFYRDVEIALSLLDEQERLIIHHEFFIHSSETWWENYFSKKTFIRKRDKAIKNFVRLFHEIH